ncbi:ERAD pathway [Tritrichomonas musculus]|uniref:ERAD pathway n=1 Tax=Tritrichomonas musculus TaxID=1915356 RepID=A0ABR2KPH5_9EUKA
MCDGVALVEHSQILVGKPSPIDYDLSRKRIDEMIQNCDLAIDILTKDGVHLKGISGKEVNENKEKFILSLNKSVSFNNDRSNINDKTKYSTKSKVTHYTAELHYKQALMQWAFDRTESYPDINEFQPYCLSLCALLDSFYPDKINFYSLYPKNTEKNAKIAIKVMQELNIPVLFDLADTQSTKINDKALLTQLAEIKISIEKVSPLQATISKSRKLILDDEFVPHKEEGNNRRYAGRKRLQKWFIN